MLLDALLGATTALGLTGSLAGLMYYRRNGNGHAPPPPAAPLAVAEPEEDPDEDDDDPAAEALVGTLIETLDEVPRRIEASFDWLVNALVEVTDKYTEAPAPVWSTEVLDRLDRLIDKIPITVTMPGPKVEIARGWDDDLARITDRLDAIIQLGPPQPSPEMLALTDATIHLMSDLRGLPGALETGLTKMEQRLTASIRSSGGSGGGFSPPRLLPPPVPRVSPPDPLPLPTPAVPPAYVGGTVWTPAGAVANLLLLIQQQLAPNCPGTCVEFRLEADNEVFVGAASFLGGPLTETNFAYTLEPNVARLYRSNFPGSSTPIGDLQVLATSSVALHVEVQT